MNFLRGLGIGVRSYRKAGRVLLSRPFRWFLIFPVIVTVVLFVAGNYLVSSLGMSLSDTVQRQIATWISGIPWLEWLNGGVGFVVRVLVRILYFFLFISWGGYVVMVIMTPVYSWLSERIEAHLSGVEYSFSIKQLFWEIGRGILVALRCFLFQTVLMLVLFFCSFIPVFGLVTPFIVFFVSAYFYGFAFMDYAIERKRLKVKESMVYMRRNAGVVIGIGSIFALSLMIPFLRIIACCFVSLFSVAAGTFAVEEFLDAGNGNTVKRIDS